MFQIVLVIHLLITLALIGIVLMQRSEGGALGIGGGGGGGAGGGGLLTGRGTANLLTRTTAILATCFMLTSVTLTILVGVQREPSSILEGIGNEELTPLAPLPATEGDGGAAGGEGGTGAPSVPVQ